MAYSLTARIEETKHSVPSGETHLSTQINEASILKY